MESSRNAGGFDAVGCGAGAALDALLAAHPVDRRGRCRSCRRQGWLRNRVCLVYVEAHYWLSQPTSRVQPHLVSELGVELAPLPDAADPEGTAVLPRIEPEPSDSSTCSLQTPAVPPPSCHQVGRPELDHGGI
ncbi:MAG: hypothetical protein M3460_05540, partial [Actinomycetota bacterium]|nr:hypothetical protein [Actinomycetota bacterium]